MFVRPSATSSPELGRSGRSSLPLCSRVGACATEIKRSIESISQNILTSTLRGLERDGYVSRTVTPSIPPRVDYKLTTLGHDVLVPISAVATWALRQRGRLRKQEPRSIGKGYNPNRLCFILKRLTFRQRAGGLPPNAAGHPAPEALSSVPNPVLADVK